MATAVSGGATIESGLSNAEVVTFLAAQEVSGPVEGEVISTGRPTLSWTATEGAVGYLHYVYDKDPWDPGATLIWSNYPQSTVAMSASYPTGAGPLGSGTYFWWVAGVSFDRDGKAEAFTFSSPRTFVVP